MGLGSRLGQLMVWSVIQMNGFLQPSASFHLLLVYSLCLFYCIQWLQFQECFAVSELEISLIVCYVCVQKPLKVSL